LRSVLDASALFAYLAGEPGWEQVRAAMLPGSVIGAVNLAEVATLLLRRGLEDGELRAVRDNLPIEVFAVDDALALDAAFIDRLAPRSGLSLGDRFCLALARRTGLPALTADRAWAQHGAILGLDIVLIR
jgi:ribonuclease VapC